MNVKEAVNTIIHFCDYITPSEEYEYLIKSELAEAHEMAIMALRKQIPEKQRIDNEDWRCCPRCDETFFLTNAFNKRNKYCGNCGQALDWGADNG